MAVSLLLGSWLQLLGGLSWAPSSMQVSAYPAADMREIPLMMLDITWFYESVEIVATLRVSALPPLRTHSRSCALDTCLHLPHRSIGQMHNCPDALFLTLFTPAPCNLAAALVSFTLCILGNAHNLFPPFSCNLQLPWSPLRCGF